MDAHRCSHTSKIHDLYSFIWTKPTAPHRHNNLLESPRNSSALLHHMVVLSNLLICSHCRESNQGPADAECPIAIFTITVDGSSVFGRAPTLSVQQIVFLRMRFSRVLRMPPSQEQRYAFSSCVPRSQSFCSFYTTCWLFFVLRRWGEKSWWRSEAKHATYNHFLNKWLQ